MNLASSIEDTQSDESASLKDETLLADTKPNNVTNSPHITPTHHTNVSNQDETLKIQSDTLTDVTESIETLEANFNSLVNNQSDEKSKVKNKELEEDLKTQGLSNICVTGHTFLWDLLVTYSSIEETQIDKRHLTGNDDDSPVFENNNQAATGQVIQYRSAVNQQEKILKEAEKQLQMLLCLPSTDRRIRMKFIENCLLNLKMNKACVFSLRLLTKLFSSFQQYSSNSSSVHTSSSSSSTITSPRGNFR